MPSNSNFFLWHGAKKGSELKELQVCVTKSFFISDLLHYLPWCRAQGLGTENGRMAVGRMADGFEVAETGQSFACEVCV